LPIGARVVLLQVICAPAGFLTGDLRACTAGDVEISASLLSSRRHQWSTDLTPVDTIAALILVEQQQNAVDRHRAASARRRSASGSTGATWL
jgi:hypothetical protein